MIDNVPRTATVRARTACLLLVLAREDFLRVLQALPELRALFERAAHANDRTTGSTLLQTFAGAMHLENPRHSLGIETIEPTDAFRKTRAPGEIGCGSAPSGLVEG